MKGIGFNCRYQSHIHDLIQLRRTISLKYDLLLIKHRAAIELKEINRVSNANHTYFRDLDQLMHQFRKVFELARSGILVDFIKHKDPSMRGFTYSFSILKILIYCLRM